MTTPRIAIWMIATVIAAALGAPSGSIAQQFVDTGAALPGVDNSAAEWGDYDRDGDLDLVLCGFGDEGRLTALLRNDDGTLADTGVPLVPTASGTVRWGDYDRDGDLDLVIMGVAGGSGNDVTRIYRSDGQDVFVDIGAGLTGVMQSDASWVDVDIDGDLDLFIGGHSLEAGGGVVKFYRNEGTDAFVEVPTTLHAFRRGSMDWADYDLDGDPDVVLTGLLGLTFTPRSELYRNDGNAVFTIVPTGLLDVYDGAARWGDFDADGDPDILLTGTDASFQIVTHVYRNDAGSFVELGQDLTGAGEGSSVAWGDTDGDGDLDFVATAVLFGQTSHFRNDAGTFIEGGSELDDVCCGSLAWGDYDGDADLDLFLSGLPSVSHLYRNILSEPNDPPGPPQDLDAVANGDIAELHWSAATDPETPAAGLTYNVRVGRAPGGEDVVSPMAFADGRRLVVATGNAGASLAWSLHDLEAGTYFWSVQAIDNEFAGSVFAPEDSFTIMGPTDTPPVQGEPGDARQSRLGPITPQPVQAPSIARFDVEIPVAGVLRVDVFDLQGRLVANIYDGAIAAGRHRLSWQPQNSQANTISPGIYWVRAATSDWAESRKVSVVR